MAITKWPQFLSDKTDGQPAKVLFVLDKQETYGSVEHKAKQLYVWDSGSLAKILGPKESTA